MLFPLLRSDSVVTPVVGELEVSEAFLALALPSAPYLLLAYLISGLALTFLPDFRSISRHQGSAFAQALRGAAVGLPTPIGTRSALPSYNALIESGVPAAAALAFLVTAPVISVDAILISIPLLGPHLAFARVSSALIIAILVSLIVGRAIPQLGQAFAKRSLPPQRLRSLPERLLGGFRLSLTDVIDRATPWLLLGLVLAAFAEPLIRVSFVARIAHPFDLALFSTVGLPIYLCASGATPLAAIFLHKGVTQGAVIAFLLTGPIANVATFVGLHRMHGLRVAMTFGAVIVVAAIALGWIISAFLPVDASLLLHSTTLENASFLQIGSLLVLALLVAASLLRQGPRGFLDQVLPHHDHDHGTEDCCGEADVVEAHDHDEHEHDHDEHEHDHEEHEHDHEEHEHDHDEHEHDHEHE
jgi:hypothetical protein